MKIEQMNQAPGPIVPTGTKAVQSPRERAINALLGSQQAQKAPVSNPTQVAPEEMSALSAAPKESNPELDDFEKAKLEAQKHSEESETPTPPAETKAVEEPLSAQYAIIARKEKAIRQREQLLKDKEAAIKAKEDASKATSQASSFDETKYVSKDKLSKDPFSVLTEMGLTYDQLTELALNGPKPKDIEMMNELKSLKEELKALKGESETTKKSFLDYQSQNESLGINQLTKQATLLVNSNPEFETIKETGSIGDVVDLIKQTLKEDGIVLTVEEAAQQVEDYLLEEALKLAKIKKIQQRLAPKAPAAEAAAPVNSQPKQQQLKTLTNAVGSSRTLSARERAILAMEGKLSK